MAITVTPNLLRDLAGFRARSGCAISVYLDLDPSVTPTTPDVDARFRSMLNELEKDGEAQTAGRDCRMAVRNDLERLRHWWDTDFDRDGAHGLAIFASSADGFFVVLPLPKPVRDARRIGEELLVTPLVDQFADDGALVAVVSREQGRVYRLRSGRLDEVVDETAEQPGQHDQGGWSQARYQRHIDHLVQQHLKSVGEQLDRRAARGGLQLVIVCPEEMRGRIADELSQDAREAIAGWTTAEAHASEMELLRVVRPVLAAADARRHEAALARFEEGRGRNERATAGWADTLEAAADTRVDTLLLTEGANRTVFQCPECRRAFVEDGTCPIDDVALERRDDAAAIAVRHVLANAGSVLTFAPGAFADDVGALLRF